jgi:hypothetical protein
MVVEIAPHEIEDAGREPTKTLDRNGGAQDGNAWADRHDETSIAGSVGRYRSAGRRIA